VENERRILVEWLKRLATKVKDVWLANEKAQAVALSAKVDKDSTPAPSGNVDLTVDE
jgi:hypothetical protein